MQSFLRHSDLKRINVLIKMQDEFFISQFINGKERYSSLFLRQSMGSCLGMMLLKLSLGL